MNNRRLLGQIFLSDKKYIDRIINSLNITGETVVEIGPGKGVMTEGILGKAKFLQCVEIDKILCVLLRDKFNQFSNLEIFQGNILKFSFAHLSAPVIVFGNIPYQISKDLIKYLIKNRRYIKKAYLTCQKEFAEKLIAQPSTEFYCALSCLAQFYAKVEKKFDIPANAFSPIPAVDSTFIEIDFYPKSPYAIDNAEFFLKVMYKAFTTRRKKILNALLLNKEEIDALASLGVNLDCRPENLSVSDYVKIANMLKNLRTRV